MISLTDFVILVGLASLPAVNAVQLPWYSNLLHDAQSPMGENPYHEFPVVNRVAVIGAGPSGLQHAVELREAGFTVRLFERKQHPGGNWYYQDDTPLPEVYPQPPPSRAAFTPDLGPDPRARVARVLYDEGQDGISIRDRLLEHAVPSSVWESLHTNSASGITHFITSPLPENSPWELSQWSIRRHVRAFASNHELNSNDVDVSNVTSYNTRVEHVAKQGNEWRLSLRKFQHLPRTNQIEATWWNEVRSS